MTPAELAAARALVRLALAEDLGCGLRERFDPALDATSRLTIPEGTPGAARVVARTPGVLAGLPIIELVFAALEGAPVAVAAHAADGESLAPGQTVASFAGPLRSILVAERTILNFLQRLSGVATLTRRYADAVAGTKAVVLDTRKTTPGWRLLEKYAVRQGGGHNHRVGLSDGILIKDNHLAGLGASAGGAIATAVRAARAGAAGLTVEVEVDTLTQLREALAELPDIVLLDNMPPDVLREAVAMRDALAPAVLLEASGGVNLSTVRAIAETGVDRISVGALTHSAPALDLALDYGE